ncbi:MAG: 4a-hydroxytetrahydrobiopterin dehydratase [Nitrososphaerota archaeon]|nr:4a-hydroxytetrahydrobiopterin dehydratase [Nitrososphaerota archaeon]MDG6941639.1 4a-hydroxytetrahydrobiopterin dehydratase [Nitrososphaerota archaeon]MDG6947187.1 4a-hydroxytetrahydrobiopterin dehydratase [Nitrososphaerota archaeon]MDG6951235.1 4a-hydroxytetrahydrobiopterin dehydratase [Nitrososphaerota archaeon]
MTKLLPPSEIDARLKRLEGWKREGDFITKTYHFKEFMDGIAFVNKVAGVAEKQEHHPDVHVRYTAVTLSLQTHSAGGVTAWDLGLARAIERAIRATAREGRTIAP